MSCPQPARSRSLKIRRAIERLDAYLEIVALIAASLPLIAIVILMAFSAYCRAY